MLGRDSTIDRKGFLKRTLAGVAATGAGSAIAATPPAVASGGSSSQYPSPFPPHPTVELPDSWHVYTGLTPVIVPAGVYVSSVPLEPLPEVRGLPDLTAVPPNATLLCLYHEEMPADWNSNGMPTLNRGNMDFTSMGGGAIDPMQMNFRRFIGAWTATAAGKLYLLHVFLYVGPQAGPEWASAQAIVNSVALHS